jgi:hypothetical protein
MEDKKPKTVELFCTYCQDIVEVVEKDLEGEDEYFCPKCNEQDLMAGW